MKTAQSKAIVFVPAMLGRFIIGLAFMAGLALGAAGSATAQSGPICSKFDSGKDGWGPCSWAPNVTVTTTTSGGIGENDPFLQITDLAGASAVCSTDSKYLGNWVGKMGGCGQFCFDFKVFSSGFPPSAITPSFSIYSGTSKATFYANFQVAIGDTKWHQKICAPIMLGDSAPPSPNGHWVISGGTWNSIITNVTMVSLPIDFSSSPSEVVGYDNICMSPGGCGEKPKEEITGCLKDSKFAVKCNPDGSYTFTLSGAGTSGSVITLVSQTPGVTVTPPQQPWAATTTWTISGATPGQLVALNANASKTGGGTAPGSDECCSGDIKVVMPECVNKPPIDLKVEKENTPSGGQGNGFNVWVTNVGAPITFAPGELTVKDVVPAGLTISTQSSSKWTCNPLPAAGLVTITCTYNLSGSLGTGAQLTDSLVFSGVLTNKQQPLKNCAIVSIPATVGVDTNPSNDQACVTVSDPQVGVLVVNKEAEYIGPILLPLQPYPINFNCTGGPSGTVNVTPGTPQTIGNIPYGSTCTLSEGAFTTPPNLCPPTWTPVWTTTYVPSSSIPINAPTTTVTVKNKLTCQAPGVGILRVQKQVNQSNYEMNVSSLTFPATATCGGTNYPLTLSTIAPVTVGPLPLGTTCSVTESISSLPIPVSTCPAGNTPSWLVSTTPASVPIGTTPVTIVVMNTFVCSPPPTQACALPMVPGAVLGVCVCPSGTVQHGKECVKLPPPPPPPPPFACAPPMVPGPIAGVCVCPQGTVQRGRRCVPPMVCRAPLIQNAAGTACVCPVGTVQRGRECVRPAVCNPPAKLNRRGACECPRDMIARGNTCIERERPRPAPGDIIRIVPGGGRDSPRPDRENPSGPRGGDPSGPRGGSQSPGEPGRR